MRNRQIILAKRPRGMPHLDTFQFVDLPLPALQDNEVLLRSVYISVDPYMRGRMREGPSYTAPFAVGEPIHGGVVGEVIESKAAGFEKGDYVLGNLPWQLYTAVNPESLQKLDPEIAPVSTALGILGMPGLTAYFGLIDIGQPKEGETVVVSGAAGAVGSAVGQIAKLKGARVVGISGSTHKVEYLKKELGFDEAIDYKTSHSLVHDLKKACPKGVDVYFDNVGGSVSDAVMPLLNDFARIPICGQIALYNQEDLDVGPRVQTFLLIHRALMKGYIVSDYAPRFPEARHQLGKWVQEGKIKFPETVTEGFDKLPEAFLGLFRGKNIGKQLVKVG